MTKHKGQHRPGQHTAEGQATRSKRIPASKSMAPGAMEASARGVYRSRPEAVLSLLKRASDAISGKNKS